MPRFDTLMSAIFRCFYFIFIYHLHVVISNLRVLLCKYGMYFIMCRKRKGWTWSQDSGRPCHASWGAMSTILISRGKIQTMSQIWKWKTANFANLWIMSWSHTIYQMHYHFTVEINFPMVFQYLIQPVTRGNKSYTNQVLFSIILGSIWAAFLILHTTCMQFFLSFKRVQYSILSNQQMQCDVHDLNMIHMRRHLRKILCNFLQTL